MGMDLEVIRESVDRLVDTLVAAPGHDGSGTFTLQTLVLGARDLLSVGYREGGRPDSPETKAALDVFAAAYDAGQPLRRLEVDASGGGDGSSPRVVLESTADYQEFARSWRPWQNLCCQLIIAAADAAFPAGWQHAGWCIRDPGYHLRLQVQAARATPTGHHAIDVEQIDAPPLLAALRADIEASFRLAGRWLDDLELDVLADGRAATTWYYALGADLSYSLTMALPGLGDEAEAAPPGALAALAPPAGSAPSPARARSHAAEATYRPAPPTLVDRAAKGEEGEHWDRLLHALGERTGSDWLRPPATEAELARLEAAFGHPIPDALRAGWLRHDGQHLTDHTGRFFGVRWLSIEEIFDLGTFDDPDDWDSGDTVGDPAAKAARQLRSVPPGAVQLWHKHPGWLPVFRRSLEPAYLAVDLAPGPDGHPGQVIVCDQRDDQRVVVARSAHALLAWMDAEATAGKLTFYDAADDDHDHVAEGCHLTHSDDPQCDLITNLCWWRTS
jgi:cell wall assembly regulator SMI1